MSAEEEDTVEGGEEAVRVFVRIRPLNKRERDEHQTIGWNYSDTSLFEDTQNGQRVYAYDRCFGIVSTNAEVYEVVGKPVVLKAMEGYNGTVFTCKQRKYACCCLYIYYMCFFIDGQTGSGKTFTMRGSDSDPGMMILCIRDMFDYIGNHTQSKFVLKASYMEVYNEEINDLLGNGPVSLNKFYL